MEKPTSKPSSRLLTAPLVQFGVKDEATNEERQDAALNRQRVLKAARTLFAEHGVEAVTMKDIAAAAGVGKGTLYRRFPDKGSLCLALIDAAVRQFQQEVLSGFGEAGRGLSSLGHLKLFLARLVEFTEREAPLLKPAQEAGMNLGKQSYYSRGIYDWQRVHVLVMLREAVADGECRPNLDLEYLADAVLAPLQLDLYLYHRQVRGYSPERITNGLLTLLQGVVL